MCNHNYVQSYTATVRSTLTSVTAAVRALTSYLAASSCIVIKYGVVSALTHTFIMTDSR